MFFFLKIIKPFFLPPMLIFLAFVVGVVCVWRKKRRLALVFLCCALGVYYFLSIEPLSYFLAWSLERSATQSTQNNEKDVQAIVVLAGGANKKEGRRPFPELGGASWRRLWHGIELYRQYDGKIPLLYSGGSGDPFDTLSVEAKLAQEYASSAGVPQEMFWTEDASRTTAESGDAIHKILTDRFSDKQLHTIILVTSARHMPRSLAVMRKRGIEVISSSADFSIGSLSVTPLSFFPSAGNLSSSVESIHEWVGIAGYWALGRI